MEIFHKKLPLKEGEITIVLKELEVKNLLLDLYTKSENHRTSTEKIESELKSFIKECQK